jgi:hypothetical protein
MRGNYAERENRGSSAHGYAVPWEAPLPQRYRKRKPYEVDPDFISQFGLGSFDRGKGEALEATRVKLKTLLHKSTQVA